MSVYKTSEENRTEINATEEYTAHIEEGSIMIYVGDVTKQFIVSPLKFSCASSMCAFEIKLCR